MRRSCSGAGSMVFLRWEGAAEATASLSIMRRRGAGYTYTGAPEGEKLRRIGQDAQAVFCVVGRTAPQPERFTTEYESIMASGVVSVVSDDGERMRALSLIVEKYSPGYEEQGAVYARKSFARTVVLRLDIRSMTGKCKRLGR